MNRIASTYKMNLIKNSAVPLHERKRKADEKSNPPTFEKMLKNAAVSHALGVDASHDTEEKTNAAQKKQNADVVETATVKIIEENNTPMLTNEQIAYLNDKYDFQNMTVYSPEIHDFFNDLVEMNLISAQAKNAIKLPIPLSYKEGVSTTYTGRDGVERCIVEKHNSFLNADGTLIGSFSALMKNNNNSAYKKVVAILNELSPKAPAVTETTSITDSDFMEKIKGTIAVPVGRNELPKFMEYLEKALADGECLSAALTKWSHEKTGYCEELGRYKCRLGAGRVMFQESDWFHIDPNTGEIKHAFPPGIRLIRNGNELFGDRISADLLAEMTNFDEKHDDAVWDLARDLQQFLRYTYFRQEEDCFDEIDKLLEEIKARQDGKCTLRFDEVAKVLWVDA